MVSGIGLTELLIIGVVLIVLIGVIVAAVIFVVSALRRREILQVRSAHQSERGPER